MLKITVKLFLTPKIESFLRTKTKPENFVLIKKNIYDKNDKKIEIFFKVLIREATSRI